MSTHPPAVLIGIYLHPLAGFGSFGKAGEGYQIVTRFRDAKFEGSIEPGGRGDEIGHKVPFHSKL